jgi:chromate reductase
MRGIEPRGVIVKVLALSGSLRAASINSALLHAAARLAPPDMEVSIFKGLGDLPLFNPDSESPCPAGVQVFRHLVSDADALLIASPEYAHGVTGTIKNALDWLVGFELFVGKCVAVLNASPRAYHADTALRETLRTMSAEIVEPASISIPLLGAHLDVPGMVATPCVANAVQDALKALLRAVASSASETRP